MPPPRRGVVRQVEEAAEERIAKQRVVALRNHGRDRDVDHGRGDVPEQRREGRDPVAQRQRQRCRVHGGDREDASRDERSGNAPSPRERPLRTPRAFRILAVEPGFHSRFRGPGMTGPQPVRPTGIRAKSGDLILEFRSPELDARTSHAGSRHSLARSFIGGIPVEITRTCGLGGRFQSFAAPFPDASGLKCASGPPY